MKNIFVVFIWLHLLISPLCNAEDTSIEKSEDPLYFMGLADKFKDSDVEYAKKALMNALTLLQQKPDNELELQVLIKQASIANVQQDYLKSQNYLDKANVLFESITPRKFTLDLKQLLTEVKLLQIEAEIKRSQKKYQESINLLNNALSVIKQKGGPPPLLQNTFSLRGDVYLEMEQLNLAITSYLLSQHHVAMQTNEAKINLWNKIAYIYSKLNDNYSAIKYLNRVLALLIKDNNIILQAKVLLNISRLYKNVSAYKEALSFGNKALQVAKDTDNEEFTLESLLHLSTIYRLLSSYENALEYGIEVLNIYKNKNDLNGIASSLNVIGLIYNRLEQRENAKSYFEQVVNFPVEQVKPKYYAAALRELAFYQYHQQHYTPALKLSQQAYQIYANINDLKGMATVKKNLGLIYQALGEVELAFKSFKFGVDAAEKTGQAWELAENLADIAFLYAHSQPSKTQHWANESLLVSKKIQAKPVISQAYSALTLAEENMKNFKQALSYAKQKAAIEKEIQLEAINKHAAEMHALQDVITKLYEFELLKEKVAGMSEKIRQQSKKLKKFREASAGDEALIKKLHIILGLLLCTTLIIISFFIIKLRKANGTK